MEVLTQSLVVHATMLLFAWVPFALVAFLVEREPGREHVREPRRAPKLFGSHAPAH